MTAQEFSNEFDVLYNNITSNQAPGLDEYEKSVFLTKAQSEILLSYFNPRLNKPQQGFDDNERRQIDFSTLIKDGETTTFTSTTQNSTFDDRGYDVTLGTDVLLILNETVKSTSGSTSIYLQVIPLKYDEYTRLMSKPYKRPLHYQAWRIQTTNIGTTGVKSTIILPPSITSGSYNYRYVKRPHPIIVGDLDGLTIDGYTYGTPSGSSTTVCNGCELDPILHKEILQRAVELAKAAYQGDLNSQIALGNISATEKGIVTSGK